MNKNIQKYTDRQNAIAVGAEQINKVCISPLSVLGRASGAEAVEAVTEAALVSPLFESLGVQGARAVATSWATAIRDYATKHGVLPRQEILASCAETLSLVTQGGSGNSHMMFESAAGVIASTDGIPLRQKTAALILPVALHAATSDAATFVEGGRDEAEIFEIKMQAGVGYADVPKASHIDEFFGDQYASMKQIYLSPAQPDGAAVKFLIYAYKEASPASPTDTIVGVIDNHNIQAMPIKKGATRILLNGRAVAADRVGATLFGQFEHAGVTHTLNANSTLDSASTGVIAFQVTPALPGTGAVLSLQFDADVEANPAITPMIENSISSFMLSPHDSVIGAQHTVQAFWTMGREYGVEMSSLSAREQRNLLAYGKDVRNLRDMIMASSFHATKIIPLNVTAGSYFKEKYEELHQHLLELSQTMLADTKTTGVTGLFVGAGAGAAIKALGAPHFVPAPNYRQEPNIHYCGMLFGKWKVYEVPMNITVGGVHLSANKMLAYGRGNGYGQSGLLAGDAVPATMYRHGTLKGLVNSDTLYERSFGDVSPREGYKYFRMCHLTFS